MTPTGKAEDLHHKFYMKVKDWDLAKQCALIAVEELIEEDKNLEAIVLEEIDATFWHEVKDEIEKL